MLNLEGVLSIDVTREVREYVSLRFKDANALVTPEALALHEQCYMSDAEIKTLCEKAYGFTLEEPIRTYMPTDIIRTFTGTNCVPVTYMPMQKKVVAVRLPEVEVFPIPTTNYEVVVVPTTLYYYVQVYQEYYGYLDLLADIPPKLILDIIVKEALMKQAADITISTVGKRAAVYFNVRKRKVASQRIFAQEDMVDILKYICIKSPYDFGSMLPKYIGIDLNEEYRGRVVINSKFKGYEITIRPLPNKAFDTDIHDLNLTEQSMRWLQDTFLDNRVGLRLIVGATMSGKNTTALSLLREVVAQDNLKVVSVEMPVEQELPGVEQINAETADVYRANIQSLIRQNPDFVYVTEMGDGTAIDVMQVTNTGKRVISTLHANSVPDVISRLIDLTGLSSDRIIQTLHSVTYQELVRDEERDFIYPRNRYVVFDDELKYALYGKPLGEVIKILKQKEAGDTWTS